MEYLSHLMSKRNSPNDKYGWDWLDTLQFDSTIFDAIYNEVLNRYNPGGKKFGQDVVKEVEQNGFPTNTASKFLVSILNEKLRTITTQQPR